MPDILVRPVIPADAGAIHRLNRECFGYEFPLAETRQRLAEIMARPENMLFAAELDGRVVGYAHSANYDCTYTPHLKNILAIGVDPALQARGIGRRLLGAVEGWAAETGAAGVRLVSGHNRAGAHSFYAACGYSLRKEQKNFIKYF